MTSKRNDKILRKEQDKSNASINKDIQLDHLRAAYAEYEIKELNFPEDINAEYKQLFFGLDGKTPLEDISIKDLTVVVGFLDLNLKDMLVGHSCPYCVWGCRDITAKMLWRHPGSLP